MKARSSPLFDAAEEAVGERGAQVEVDVAAWARVGLVGVDTGARLIFEDSARALARGALDQCVRAGVGAGVGGRGRGDGGHEGEEEDAGDLHGGWVDGMLFDVGGRALVIEVVGPRRRYWSDEGDEEEKGSGRRSSFK